ncbi:hypothetical protein BGX28_006378 [Mortierella sp. GBA30]|nr:hypothetical protein BGX28_006378 [Mortierella sp. GBA30]
MQPHRRQHQQHTQAEQKQEQARESCSPPPSSSFPRSSVVDIGAIELEKENIQPIKEGRSAQALARLFETRPVDRVQELALQREHFQQELEQIEDLDDPMDVYARFVKWTLENYPQSAAQGHDSQLMLLLEQAFDLFKDDQMYKNDPRFIKLLILYAEKAESPQDVYKYMEINSIGSEIAMYYQEYADYMESREEFDKAKEIILLGVNRRARPLSRLKKQYDEFLKRERQYMEQRERTERDARPPTLLTNRQGSATLSNNSSSNVNRRVLGVRLTDSESIPSNASARGHVSIGSGGASASSAFAYRQGPQSNNIRPNARLAVFSDQSLPPTSGAFGRSVIRDQENTSWAELGTERIRRKENIREATSWKGAKLSIEDTFARKPQPRLQVYRDPENIDSALDIQPVESSSTEDDFCQVSESTKTTHIPVVEQEPHHQPSEEEIRARHPGYTIAGSSTKGTAETWNRNRSRKPPVPIQEVLPRSPSDDERTSYGAKRRLTSSPTLNTRAASAVMNQIFSDRSKARRSMDSQYSQWSTEDSQDVDHNDLDNHTMAYSIPTLPPAPLSPSRAEYLENAMQDDDDDYDYHGRRSESEGRTEEFVKRMEQGFPSTITQNIEEMRRQREARASFGGGGSNHTQSGDRLSFRRSSRGSWKLESLRNAREYSDITLAIQKQKRAQEQQRRQQQDEEDHLSYIRKEQQQPQRAGPIAAESRLQGHISGSGSNRPRSSLGPSRYAGSSEIAVEGLLKRFNGPTNPYHHPTSELALRASRRTLKVFQDGADNMNVGMGVPMIEDEAPPPCLDDDEPL